MVPGGEGIQGSPRLRVRPPRDQAPGGAREGRGAVQGDAAGVAQRSEDRAERGVAGEELQAEERDHQAFHPPQHDHLRVPARGRDRLHFAAVQSGDEVSSSCSRVQMRQSGDGQLAQAAAADADREAGESEEVRGDRE